MTMKSNKEKCILCVQHELTNLCIVSDEELSENCPCKECLVRVTCTNSDQSCDEFLLLYDQAIRSRQLNDKS